MSKIFISKENAAWKFKKNYWLVCVLTDNDIKENHSMKNGDFAESFRSNFEVGLIAQLR